MFFSDNKNEIYVRGSYPHTLEFMPLTAVTFSVFVENFIKEFCRCFKSKQLSEFISIKAVRWCGRGINHEKNTFYINLKGFISIT